MQDSLFEYIAGWQMVAKPLPDTFKQMVKFDCAWRQRGIWMWVLGFKFVGLWLFGQWAAWNLHPFVGGFARQLCTFSSASAEYHWGSHKNCTNMSFPFLPPTKYWQWVERPCDVSFGLNFYFFYFFIFNSLPSFNRHAALTFLPPARGVHRSTPILLMPSKISQTELRF